MPELPRRESAFGLTSHRRKRTVSQKTPFKPFIFPTFLQTLVWL